MIENTASQATINGAALIRGEAWCSGVFAHDGCDFPANGFEHKVTLIALVKRGLSAR